MTISTPAPESTKFADRISRGGPLILSGDVAHFCDNFRHRRVPTFNADYDKSRSSMDRVDSLARHEHAALLINHDARQSALIRRSPDSIE
jgi:N-acyl homoserine lactone hydrolase